MGLYLFDRTLVVIEIIPDESITESEQEAERCGLISHSVTAKYTESLDKAAYFGMRDPLDRDNFWIYKIVTRKKEGYEITVDGIYKLFDDLKAQDYIKDVRPQKAGFDTAIKPVLQGSGWEMAQNSVTGIASANFYYKSRLHAFWEAVKTWRCEFKPKIIFTNGKIVSQRLYFADNFDEDFGRLYVYGDRLLTVTASTSEEELYTAFIGRGKGEEKKDGSGEATGGYGRKITFKDIAWSKAKGDPVDKPLGQVYIEIPSATALYGYADGKPRIGFVEFNDVEDPAELLRLTYEYAKTHSRPMVQFKSTVFDDRRISLYEVVRIKNPILNIAYKTRVFKSKRSFLLPAKQEIEFGERLIKSQAQQIADGNRAAEKEKVAQEGYITSVAKSLTDKWLNEDGYNYLLSAKNEYRLPAGYYSFNAPIDQNPTKMVGISAGKLVISDAKNPDGSWNIRTFGTGEGFTADLIRAGMLQGGAVKWNLETGYLNIGDKLIYDPATGELRFASGSITMGSLDSDTQEKIQGAYDSAKELEKGYTEIKEGEARFVTKSQLGTVGETSINGYNVTTGAIRSQNGATNIDLNGSAFTFGFGAMTYEKSKGLRIGGDRFYMTSDNRCFAIHSNEWVNGRLGGFRGTTNSNGSTNGVMLYASHGFNLRLCTQLDQEDNTYANHLILFHNRSGDVWTEIVCDTFVRAKLTAVGSGTIQATEMRSSSDIRLKKDIKPWDVKALDVINATDFIRFRWKDGDDVQEHYGVSAQSIPMAQVKRDDGYLAVDGYTMSAINGKAIQELSGEVKRLKEENEKMKQELKNLKEAVHDLVERS